MSIDNLKHQHGGKIFKFNIDNLQVRDIMLRIVSNQNDAAMTIATAMACVKDRTMYVACKQCMLDAALQMRDAASAIEELMELK